MVKSIQVLLVDDDPLVLSVVGAILRTIGCQVTPVDTPAGALKLLESSSFDLVLSDYLMPSLNGAELTRKIVERGDNIPVAVMTGGRTEAIITHVLAAGAVDCLEKPIHRQKLIALFDKIIAMN